jgi:hypothetical protein
MRPLVPNSTDDLFRHPLFFINDLGKDRATLVVPILFLKNSVNFHEFTDLASTSYYILPNLAQYLFAYAEEPTNHVVPFSEYYYRHQKLWMIEERSENSFKLIRPHPDLRIYWRWMEVLWMLWDLRTTPKRANRLPWFTLGPTLPCAEISEIAMYLDGFGEMAKEWQGIWPPRFKRATPDGPVVGVTIG